MSDEPLNLGYGQPSVQGWRYELWVPTPEEQGRLDAAQQIGLAEAQRIVPLIYQCWAATRLLPAGLNTPGALGAHVVTLRTTSLDRTIMALSEALHRVEAALTQQYPVQGS